MLETVILRNTFKETFTLFSGFFDEYNFQKNRKINILL